MEIAEGEGERGGGDVAETEVVGGWWRRRSSMGEGEEVDQRELLSHSGIPFFAI